MVHPYWYDKIASSVAEAEDAVAAAADEQSTAEKLQQDIDLTQAVAADDSVTTEEKVAILENEGVEPEIIEALIDAETTDAVAAYYGVDPYWLADKKAAWFDFLPDSARVAMADPTTMSRVGTAAMGAGLGGIAGAGLGYLAGDGLGAAIGGLAGAGLGGLGGYYLPNMANGFNQAAQDASMAIGDSYMNGVHGFANDPAMTAINAVNQQKLAEAKAAERAALVNAYQGVPQDPDAPGYSIDNDALFDPDVDLTAYNNIVANDKTQAYDFSGSAWLADKRAGLLDMVGNEPGLALDAKQWMMDPANAALAGRVAMGAGLGGIAGAGLGYLAGDGLGAALGGGLLGAGLGAAGGYFAPQAYSAYNDLINRQANYLRLANQVQNIQ